MMDIAHFFTMSRTSVNQISSILFCLARIIILTTGQLSAAVLVSMWNSGISAKAMWDVLKPAKKLHQGNGYVPLAVIPSGIALVLTSLWLAAAGDKYRRLVPFVLV